MSKFDLVKDYQRDLGALTSSIPAVLYIIMMILGGGVSIYNFIWLIMTFTPIIVVSGYLDLILKSRPLYFLKTWWVKYIVSWALLFPPIRIVSIFLTSILTGEVMPIDILLIILSIVAGVLYGFFFIILYIYMLKIFKRIGHGS